MDDIVKYFNQNLNDYENKEVMDEMGTFINKKNEIIESNLSEPIQSMCVEEMNRHLTRKIQCLEEDNEHLTLLLEKQSKKKTKTLEKTKNEIDNSSSKKIFELSEKVRELSIQLKTIKEKSEENNTVTCDPMDNRLSLANKKLCNYRDQISQLKKDLELTKTALANEVGDSILQKTVNSHTGLSDRRGRAQYIILLQQKVTQLQEKLNLKNSTNTNDFDELQYKKAIEDVRREEREKKSFVELELKCALKRVNELDTSSKKWESRCKALDVEMAVLRDRLEKIQLKFQHNEKIIEEQEGKLKTTNEDTIRKLNKLEMDNKTLCQRLEEVEKTIEEETKKLLSKDLEIKQLQNELKMCKPIIIKQEMDFSNIVNEPIHKFKQLENQQLLELLLKANTEIRENILQTTDLKIELAKQKQKMKRTESKTGGMRTVSSKTCSNTSRPMSYKSTYESKQIPVNQIELKIDILNEENAALKTHIDTLTIINKDQERQFAKSLTELNKKIKTIIPCDCTKFIKSDN